MLFFSNSIYWLEYGGRFLVNISNLLSSRNFTEMHLDINNTLAIAQDAIEKVGLSIILAYTVYFIRLLCHEVTSHLIYFHKIAKAAFRKEHNYILVFTISF